MYVLPRALVPSALRESVPFCINYEYSIYRACLVFGFFVCKAYSTCSTSTKELVVSGAPALDVITP